MANPDAPIRVLMVSVAFPLPDLVVRAWAVEQAAALKSQGLSLNVVNFIPWLPRILRKAKWLRPWITCPPVHDWDGVRVRYIRWMHYRSRVTFAAEFKRPRPWAAIAWRSARNRVREIVRDFRPDVVYALGLLPASYVAMKIRDEFDVPFVLSAHDFNELEACDHRPARRELLGEIFGAASRVVVVANRMRDAVSRLWPDANVETVYNGVRAPAENLSRTPRPDDLQDRKIIFSCGSMIERKGFPILTRAFAQIADKHPRAVLRIAGDGQELNQVRAIVRESGLEDRIHLLGRVSHDRVMQEMVWADIFALVSWREPFATVYLEAVSASTPVVCCDDSGILDVVRAGEHGQSVPPRDVDAAAGALDRLLSDPQMAEEMGRNGRRLYEERLTWNQFGTRFREIFEEAVESRAAKFAPA